MKQPAAQEAVALLRTMTRVLCAVGFLALVFTTVNVTRFATSRDVPLPIAVLLDPMIGTALAGILYVDARLSSWGIRPPTWSTALRWSAGCTAALMNSWESLWPDGQIGWPRQADPAAVLLHLSPALLLIGLTETIAAYRRTITDLPNRIGTTNRVGPPVAHAAPTRRSATDRTFPHPNSGSPQQHRSASFRAGSGIPATTSGGPAGAQTGDSAPHTPAVPPAPPSADSGPADADVWPQAVALDTAVRGLTGKPVSTWRLRTDLHIGPRRARQLRDQLLARHADPPHPSE
ncbi:extensin [Wenjunlia tyrosinilytica]|uniref:Extensin n=1 Tax=Wenjunlia tyrosinilytica TaxID=1544741 RepID=A0A917ZY54_9ACTN|nr:extensin [Wenjunlia tyrosinilytica]GGO99365.1 hypothetical protein GCM10012280_65650 [Wenjunlia tyrosinilytica]